MLTIKTSQELKSCCEKYDRCKRLRCVADRLVTAPLFTSHAPFLRRTRSWWSSSTRWPISFDGRRCLRRSAVHGLCSAIHRRPLRASASYAIGRVYGRGRDGDQRRRDPTLASLLRWPPRRRAVGEWCGRFRSSALICPSTSSRRFLAASRCFSARPFVVATSPHRGYPRRSLHHVARRSRS